MTYKEPYIIAEIGCNLKVDMKIAKEMKSLEPDFIKIPSACNNNFEMLGWLCNHYLGEIHVSMGMTKKDEIEDFVLFFGEGGSAKGLGLDNCTSNYPVSFEDICLLDILKLRDKLKYQKS